MRRLAVAVILLGVVVSAQTGAPPQTPPPQTATPPASQTPAPPQFKSAIDIVRLDVSVLDKNRQPVRGLTAKDFTLLENGKPQEVSTFSAVDVPGPETPSAPWMREVAPDVRNNADIQQRRLFVIAIDDATIENDPAALKSVKTIAHNVIDRLGPSDLASVVFTRDSRGSQDFTSDRSRLLAAVDTFNGSARGMGSSGAGMPAAAGETDDMWFLYSVGVLERAVDFMTDLPERRKAIIYIGQGVPFSLETAASPVNASPTQESGAVSSAALHMRIKDQLADIFDRAQRSNVTIYPVDPCGVRRPPPPPTAGKALPATCVIGREVDYLAGLAASTGGRTVMNSNDFEPGLKAVFEENASYYLLGFQPADATRDGRFRTLEVKVNRPDVEVRTRSGYEAPREAMPDRPRPAASPLTKALAGVLPTSDLPMQITAAPFAVAGKPEAAVAITAGFKQPIRQAGEQTIENVDLQISAFNADGRSFGNTKGVAAVTIRPGASGSAEYEVFARIDLKPGRYQLRIAAFVSSQTTPGSVFFDLDVPDFAAAPVSLSGLVLSATPSPPNAPKDGLIAIMPVVPTTRRAFSATHKVSAFARVYLGGSAKPVPVTARMQIRDAKDAVIVDRKLDIPASQFGTTRAADVTFDVPVADLPTGAYVLTIDTTLGATTARRDSRFTVVK